ncbi:Putative formate dehydrogenase [Planctomycetes bacterium Poly30]|uniref:Formate dehydrogenase n=2 Tax=Saltatorellus ferox TaxID=2528018 RepID=A0A518EZ62_9BACT|nr:Putative formate dehydrogenase [Planctomycetes bacterium Poly30]
MIDRNQPDLPDGVATRALELNGRRIPFQAGETILEVAQRAAVEIPTLCHDPRLEPAGACRTCLVEVDGQRRLVPACKTPAADGDKVRTESERVDRHRKTLLALYLTDHPKDRAVAERGAPNELLDMADRYDAPRNWGSMTSSRESRNGDRNPYIHFNAETCISCARCTRYCDEVEGVSAITLANRGAHTTISTVESLSLLDTTCEMCGGCVDVCPTGAMGEKMPLTRHAKPERELTKVRSTCNFCGVGCQLDLNVDPEAENGHGRVVKVTSPPAGTTTNDGNLCVKGRFAYDFIHHEDRLTMPLVRDESGELVETSWENALAVAAAGLQGVAERHGKDALGFVSSSRCTMEENYLIQKLARAVYGTNNIHQCAAT